MTQKTDKAGYRVFYKPNKLKEPEFTWNIMGVSIRT